MNVEKVDGRNWFKKERNSEFTESDEIGCFLGYLESFSGNGEVTVKSVGIVEIKNWIAPRIAPLKTLYRGQQSLNLNLSESSITK